LGVLESRVTKREIHFWEAEIHRVGRQGVAEEFLDSDAYRSLAVTGLQAAAGRGAEAQQVKAYVASGLDLLSIQIALEGAPALLLADAVEALV
jgi:hypothetical protein